VSDRLNRGRNRRAARVKFRGRAAVDHREKRLAMRTPRLAALCVLAIIAIAGCRGGAGAAPEQPRPLVELLSWWLAPGEAEALQELIHTHGRLHPEARVFNSALDSVRRGNTVQQRLEHGDPPDLLQLSNLQVRDLYRRAPASLEIIDDLIDRLGMRAAAFPEALAMVTLDGHARAMPNNMHRANALLYNKAIFAAHHLAPPTTIAELLDVCKKLKAARITPIATSHQGWALSIMAQSIIAGAIGPDQYRALVAGGGAAARGPGRAALAAALATFGEILRDYTNPDAGEPGFSWTHAAEALYEGDAAMFLHGDWAKGYLVQLGWRAGIDFGVVPAPGTSDLFVYIIDLLAIPRGAVNARGARELLATAASIDGQVAFSRLKGSTPIRRDVGRGALDVVGEATLQDFVRARVRLEHPNSVAFDTAMIAYAADRDGDALFQRILAIGGGR
jgi:glucose/mannose transport system substrate-binding protein